MHDNGRAAVGTSVGASAAALAPLLTLDCHSATQLHMCTSSARRFAPAHVRAALRSGTGRSEAPGGRSEAPSEKSTTRARPAFITARSLPPRHSCACTC